MKIQDQLSLITKDKECFFVELAEKKVIVLIKEKKSKYLKLEYLIDSDEFLLKDITYINSCKRIFEINNFRRGFIDSQSDFYKDKNADFSGSKLCFALISKDKNVVSEISITTLVDILPYEGKIHIYLLKIIGALP